MACMPRAAAIADRVNADALSRGRTCVVIGVHLPPGASETRARRARRAALRSMALREGCDAIVLAHHADDQAETVLLRLLKGSGPAGLAGMAPVTGPWVRPLLSITRAELAAYLDGQGLVAWSDPANSDPRHLRSWLRTSIMPLLADRLPEVTQHLARAGAQAARARAAWDGVPALLAGLVLEQTGERISVAAPPLCGYRSEVRHAVLAALGRRFGVPLGERRLAVLDRLLFSERGTGIVHLSGRLAAELAFGQLTFLWIATDPAAPVVLEPGAVATLGEVRFAAERRGAGESRRHGWDVELIPGQYLARPWQPGDRIRPHGGRGSRAVSVLLREARIPPRRRAGWPVVMDADAATIVWVPGICRSDARIPEKGAEALHVECAVA